MNGVSHRISTKFDYDRNDFGNIENRAVNIIQYTKELRMEVLE